MHANLEGRPDPVTTKLAVSRTGKASLTLVMHESDVAECDRCSSSQCRRKVKTIDAELGLVRCGHRMPVGKVNEFRFGTQAVPNQLDKLIEADTDDGPFHFANADVDRLNLSKTISTDDSPGCDLEAEPELTNGDKLAGWPANASFTRLDFFGRHAMFFVWTHADWDIEENKPKTSWPIRDGRISMIPLTTGPTPYLNVCPWMGRADRSGMAETLEIEVRMNGIVAIYKVTPMLEGDAMLCDYPIQLMGNGGISSVDITCRKELLGKLR